MRFFSHFGLKIRSASRSCLLNAGWWPYHRIIRTVPTTLSLKVKPQARESRLEQLADGTWLAQVKAPPVDGKANKEVIALVATHFGVRAAQVTIKSGAGGRMKLVTVND
jgi:uncharacterized protein (TIGR00251 family)